MKILKPGKVEQRKFTCPKCGCVFVASTADLEQDSCDTWAICPQEGCGYNFTVCPKTGEPYEEPTPAQTDIESLKRLMKLWNFWSNGTAGLEQYLIENGVTFREV